jgi:hypothetical protein
MRVEHGSHNPLTIYLRRDVPDHWDDFLAVAITPMAAELITDALNEYLERHKPRDLRHYTGAGWPIRKRESETT